MLEANTYFWKTALDSLTNTLELINNKNIFPNNDYPLKMFYTLYFAQG